MQPLAGTPPVPSGAVARDAWRELDRETRRELLRSDRPHPDPAVAVIAVGYARSMLARSGLRRSLLVYLPIIVGGVALDLTLAFATNVSSTTTTMLMIVIVMPTVVARRLLLRRRVIALHRMESVNAAALWSTERPAPVAQRPVPAPAGSAGPWGGRAEPQGVIEPPVIEPAGGAGRPQPSGPVVIRYSRRFLVRTFATLAAFVVLVETVSIWVMDSLPAMVIGALLLLAVGLTIYSTFVRARPQLPMMIMNAAGFELPSMGVRLAWSNVAEVRIHPYRKGGVGKTGRHHCVALALTDPTVLGVQLSEWWAKKTRTALSVYGTPLAIADLALDHSAEQIATAAAAFANVPIRRFGP